MKTNLLVCIISVGAVLALTGAPLAASANHEYDYGQSYYDSNYPSYGDSNYASYYPSYDQSFGQSYGGYGNYGYGGAPNYAYGAGYGIPTGDSGLLGPLCYYPGYGRTFCGGGNPRQPVYDYWTGRWY